MAASCSGRPTRTDSWPGSGPITSSQRLAEPPGRPRQRAIARPRRIRRRIGPRVRQEFHDRASPRLWLGVRAGAHSLVGLHAQPTVHSRPGPIPNIQERRPLVGRNSSKNRPAATVGCSASLGLLCISITTQRFFKVPCVFVAPCRPVSSFRASRPSHDWMPELCRQPRHGNVGYRQIEDDEP